jgi:hypothetical protein
VPEALFENKDTPEKEAEAISAVKALQIAAHSANASSCVGAKQCFATPSSGQKIFTITQANIDQVLPQLAHKALIIQDVKDAVAAGKIVTISQSTISYKGWTGAGYSIVDPNTGAGAYLIGGGADGSYLDIVSNNANGFAAMAGLIGVLTTFGTVGLPVFILVLLTIFTISAILTMTSNLLLMESGCSDTEILLNSVLQMTSFIIGAFMKEKGEFIIATFASFIYTSFVPSMAPACKKA